MSITEIPRVDIVPTIDDSEMDQNSSTSVYCKICYVGDSCEQLVRPCFCTGSIGHVHFTCLEEWLRKCTTTQCEVCQYRFTYRSVRRYSIWQSIPVWLRHSRRLAEILADMIIVIVMMLLMAFIVIGFMYLEFDIGNTEQEKKKSIYTISNTSSQIVIVVCFMLFFVGFSMTILTVTQQNFHEWHEWWTNCNDVILMIRDQHVAAGHSS